MKQWVAESKQLWLGPNRRLLLLKWVLGLALLVQVSLCPKLFQTDRPFPTLPVLPSLPELPQPICIGLLLAAIGSTVWMVVTPKPRIALWLLLACIALLVLFDIDRLQPWLYLILLLLFALTSAERDGWSLCGLVIICTYIWSGLQKLNLSFATRGFPFFTHPLGLDRLPGAWFVVPLVECSVGLLLIFPKSRMWGVAGTVLTHLFILAALGPFGRNINSVIWPWTIWMPMLAAVLFAKNPQPLLWPDRRSGTGIAIMLLAAVMPAFSFAGLWDDYLSDTLYAGRNTAGYLFLTDQGVAALPSRYQRYVKATPNGLGLDIFAWAMSTMNVPPYPEARVYRQLAQQLVGEGVPPGEIKLLIAKKPGLMAVKPDYLVMPVE